MFPASVQRVSVGVNSGRSGMRPLALPTSNFPPKFWEEKNGIGEQQKMEKLKGRAKQFADLDALVLKGILYLLRYLCSFKIRFSNSGRF